MDIYIVFASKARDEKVHQTEFKHVATTNDLNTIIIPAQHSRSVRTMIQGIFWQRKEPLPTINGILGIPSQQYI